MKYLITGGTGLIGTALIKRLSEVGHDIHNLTRSNRKSDQVGLTHHKWDGTTVPDSVPNVDVVINLAGAGIADKRWTDEYKKILLESRVHATQACVDYIERQTSKPMVFVSGSGYNYYGTLTSKPKTEESPAGDGFLAEVCKKWEATAAQAGIRTVFLRTAVVLDKDEGPLAKMLTPYKFFVGGPTGSGDQGFPWIHLEDMVRAIIFLVDNDHVRGPVNMCSPQPITMRQFADTLGKVMRRPSFFRLGKGFLKLVFGELSAVLWGGGVVLPEVLKRHGFEWKYAELEPALRNLLED